MCLWIQLCHVSLTAYVSFEVFSLLRRKDDILVGLTRVVTSVSGSSSCLACVAYAWQANCEVLEPVAHIQDLPVLTWLVLWAALAQIPTRVGQTSCRVVLF